LRAAHFQVDFRSHAKAILEIDFPEVAEVIEDVLLGSTIPIEEIIRSGGGETKGTQRLRNALRAREWNKHNFIVERTIDGVPREAQSHEVDHVRTLVAAALALAAWAIATITGAARTYPPTCRPPPSSTQAPIASRATPSTSACFLGCRFRKLHPIDSRSAANQNMIAA
jgi:hypothetical protein